MKKLIFAASVLSCTAWAAEAAKPADAKAAPAAEAKPADANAMAAWKPKHATKKDTKGIEALYKEVEEAWKKGDVEAAAAHHDFPVFMLTDNAAGVTSGGEWTKEQFLQTMKPAMENMPKDVKMSTKTKITFISDSIAFVEEDHTMTPAKGKPDSWVSGSFVVLKDGKWLLKGGAEGGWGDMPMPEKKTEKAAEPAPGTKTADAKPAAAAQPAAQPAAAPAKK
jgi:uncharacterized protein (TIGR02246 family)